MNTTAQVPSVNTALNDQERMEDLLTMEKSLIGNYGTLIPEAACPNLRKVLTDNMNDCLVNQYSVYDEMNKLGWYPQKTAPAQEVTAARQKFEQIKQQMK